MPHVGPCFRPAKVNEFVRGAVEFRLRMLVPYLGQWPQAMGLMALPPNVPESLRNLGNLVDDIWYLAGDKSTDVCLCYHSKHCHGNV